jgi:diguanylate cyclase (GGDEF)-like protein
MFAKIQYFFFQKYENSDFIIQQKVKILLSICVTIIFVILTFAVSYMILGEKDPGTLLPVAISGLILIVCTVLIKYGYFYFAAHTIIIVSSSAIWINMVMESGSLLARLDTVVIAIGFMTFTSLLVSKRSSVLIGYAVANIILFLGVALYIQHQLKVTNEVIFEYIIDTMIGMASAGVGSLLIFTINRRALEKADEATKIAESEAEKNRELNRTLEQKVLDRTGELQASMEEVQYLATHDTLTGLPNRSMFSQRLNYAIQAAQRYQRQFAVLFMDLDRFKIINDTLGHEAGDQLLQEIAARLTQSLRAVDTVGRLGGDEFVILIEEVSDSNQVAAVAHKILTSVIKPITLKGQESRITASIGISMFPKDAEDEQTLMKNADIAMYLAKEEGKNNYQFYSQDIQSKSLQHLSIETNLRFALERNELSLHYQAKVDFKTNVIKGVEALLRWQNPYLGSVTPTQFIPVAEESGLIIPIGRWVLKTACAQNVAWQKQGLPAVCMSVNLSRRQLMDENLIDDIRTALNDSGMASNLLELDITEGMVMHNPALIISILTKIKSMGVRLAIDDFGTGYSSLAQIKNFPIDTLKVDRSFIRSIPKDTEYRAITEAIIAMGKTLGLNVVAEGVETVEQMNFLKEHSCDEMQGFYFSKPIMPEQFADLLRKHVPSPPEWKTVKPIVMNPANRPLH